MLFPQFFIPFSFYSLITLTFYIVEVTVIVLADFFLCCLSFRVLLFFFFFLRINRYYPASGIIELFSSYKKSNALKKGFPGGAVVKNPPADAGDTRDMGSIPGLGRSSGIGNGNPL